MTIITIHSAKGTEAPVCYVINVSPGSYPSTLAIDDLDDVEEERRVLYVALTRAQNELIVTRREFSQWATKKLAKEQAPETYFFNDLPKKLFKEKVIVNKPTKSTKKPPPAAEDFHVGIDFD